MDVNCISLFSGCGGSDLGILQSGMKIKLASDIDPGFCSTYRTNFPDHRLFEGDLIDISNNELLKLARLKKVDCVVGGPPCQGFSSAGSRNWGDDRNKLVKRFVNFVEEVKPTWFVMENVEGMLTLKKGFYFIEAIRHLLEAGYWINVRKIYMQDYGVPQKRKRVLIVGNLEGCRFKFPKISLQTQTLNNAICDIEDFSKNKLSHHQPRTVNKLDQKRIYKLRRGQTMRDLPVELQHQSYMRRANRRVSDGTPTEKRGGAPSGLKRLHYHEPALTITSAASREFIHPKMNRPLTLRECARIQTFPDDFCFSGSLSSVAVQIGNAIPPHFMKVLSQSIIEQATWKPKKNTMGRWLGANVTKAGAMSPALKGMCVDLEKVTEKYIC
jgi:DNA (cytosine-5)-methyltransferase 1